MAKKKTKDPRDRFPPPNLNEVTKSTSGGILCWKLGKYLKLKDIDHDFDNLGLARFIPSKRTDLAAFKDALSDCLPVGLIVAPNRTGDGYVVIERERQDLEPGEKWGEVRYNARIDKDCKIHLDPKEDMVYQIVNKFNFHQGYITSQMMGKQLSDLALHMDATRIVDGVYWLPPHRMNDWREAGAAVERATVGPGISIVHCCEQKMDEYAVERLIKSFIENTNADIMALRNEVDNAANLSLGEVALNNRSAKAVDMAARIERYEIMLGTRMEELKNAALEARDAASLAALLASDGPALTSKAS